MTGAIEWAFASRPVAGETVSGDMPVVVVGPRRTLLAVIDGLGHGASAHDAASAVAEVLGTFGGDALPALFSRCHRAAKATRGVAMSAAILEGPTLSWAGVGNVDAALLYRDGRRERLVSRGGIVGDRLPLLRVVSVPIGVGDLVLFATDGVAVGFTDTVDRGAEVERIAEDALAAHALPADDALVLVARVREEAP